MQHSERFLNLVNDTKKRVKEITIDEYLDMKKADPSWVLIDVREDLEWAKGRIPGAVHMGRGVIERDIEEKYPDLDTPLVLYCGGGFRSALSADNLQKMGYKRVISMDGGIRGWREKGLAEEK
jgi:rhodanese-related sulfurtransferase